MKNEASNTTIKKETIIYSINEDEKTSKIIGNSSSGEIIIPRSIIHESQEYVITSISSYAFKNSRIKTIQFSSGSELQTIERFAFWNSNIENFTVPPHLTTISESAFAKCNQILTIEIPSNSMLTTIKKCAFWKSSIERLTISTNLINLENEWCSGANNLNHITCCSNNPRYKSYEDNKYIIGKKTIESPNYEILVFCIRNIDRKATIPNFIKEIESHAFDKCNNLQKVEFSNYSEIETIHKEAFFDSSIESLTIPASLVDLKEGWCSGANNLTTISVDPKNKRYSFFDEKFIIGKSSIEQENFDVLVFCIRNIQTVIIPSFIKIIGPYAFEMCKKLKKVDFEIDSKLEIIEKFAFSCSSIEKFFIPPCLKKIGVSAFSVCENLHYLSIPSNSELNTIDENAFWTSSIKSFVIPSHISNINETSFVWCFELEIVEIDENSEINCINEKILKNFKNAIIMIPVKLNDRLIHF